jgi:hypothetical protein
MAEPATAKTADVEPAMDIKRERSIAAFAAVVSLSLGDCATAMAGSSLMDARAQATPPKPNIFDPPPQRAPAMTPDERLKLQKDLTAARDRRTKPDLTHQPRPRSPK